MLNATALRLSGHAKTEQTGTEINYLNVHYGGSQFESPPPYEPYTSTPFYFLYFVDRSSRHRFLLITNSMYFFMYLFI